MAIKAIGNKVRLTAAITGIRKSGANKKPSAFTGTITRRMHFVYR